MTQNTVAADVRTFAISLTGVRAGFAQEDLVVALQRIFPRQTNEQIRGALAKLPFLLTRAATEEQAKKIKNFLESRGAILKFMTSSAAAVTAPQAAAAPAPARPAAAQATPAPQEERPYTGVERRAKPRVHPGLEIYPMGIGEILDRSFRLLRKHFLLFFIILMIPQATFFLLYKTSQIFPGQNVQQGTTAGMGMGLLVSVLLGVSVMIIFWSWAKGALVHAVSETYLGHETSVRGAYGAMRSRLGRFLGTMILMWILLLLLILVLFFISGMIIGALGSAGVWSARAGRAIVGIASAFVFLHVFLNWLLVDKVVVLEDKAWFKALSHSTQLMKSRTERGFWKRPKNKASLILFLGFLIGFGIRLLFRVPGLLTQMLLDERLAALTLTLYQVLNVIAVSLTTVFTAIAMILFYYDIRLRSEGFDLKMMAEHL